MIALLLCRCPGAEQRARRFLERNGISDWASVPSHLGKISAYEFIKNLPPTAEGPDYKGALSDFISHAGGYIIVVGWDDNHLMWSNIKTTATKAIVDAELILERFA